MSRYNITLLKAKSETSSLKTQPNTESFALESLFIYLFKLWTGNNEQFNNIRMSI